MYYKALTKFKKENPRFNEKMYESKFEFEADNQEDNYDIEEVDENNQLKEKLDCDQLEVCLLIK